MGALAQAAFEIQLATMHFDKGFNQRQPQPRPVMGAPENIFGLTERGQNVVEMFRCDTNAGIGDRKKEVAPRSRPGPHNYFSVGRRELDGVG